MSSIVVIGMSHRTAPVEVREKFAFVEAALPEVLGKLKATGAASEAVILSTCNRVELYAATELEPASSFGALKQFLLDVHKATGLENGELFSYAEPDSVEHLFKVAAGLDSMVLGETEILGQLKKAYELALAHRHSGARLNKAFQKAFNVAKQIRTETQIQRGSISVGSVAVELAEKIFNKLEGRNVMVLGAGDTSEKTARSLASRGATNIMVSNRTFEKAGELARSLNGRAIPFGEWEGVFQGIDIIISSTSAPDYVIDRAKLVPLLKNRKNRPLLLIDIAVPRDIDPEVGALDNVYLYNVDDLQAIASEYLELRKKEVAACEEIIRNKARGLLMERPAQGNLVVRKPVPWQ